MKFYIMSLMSLFFVSNTFASESCLSYNGNGANPAESIASLRCHLDGPEGSDDFSLSVKGKTICLEKEINSSSQVLSVSSSSDNQTQFLTVTSKDGIALVSINISSNLKSGDDIGFTARVAQPVKAFYDLAFNKHKPDEAMKIYVGDKYIQHNPNVGDGKQAFVEYFLAFFPKNPEFSAEIKRIVAERDLVVLHVFSKINKQDRGRAVIDIFRLTNGKIVEHWDVGQPIPEKTANFNTMF